MALSDNAAKRIMHALGDQVSGREVIDAVNKATALSTQSAKLIVAAIVATSTSQTTDFGAVLVGDQVLMIPATAGSADLITIATAGDLGQAAVIGNIYVVLRSFVADAANSTKL